MHFFLETLCIYESFFKKTYQCCCLGVIHQVPAVDDFVSTDGSVAGATVMVSGSGSDDTLTVKPNGIGEITLSIPANRASSNAESNPVLVAVCV